VSFADEHAVMDFVDPLLGPRGQGWLERAVQLVNAAFMFLLTWLVWRKADRIWAYRDATDVLRIVYGPFVYFMAVTLALAGVIHLYKVIERRGSGRAAGDRGAGCPHRHDDALLPARAHLVRHGHRGLRGLRLHAR